MGYKSTGFIIYVSQGKELYDSRHVKFLENKLYRKIKTACTDFAIKQQLCSTKKCNKSKEKEVHYTMPR